MYRSRNLRNNDRWAIRPELFDDNFVRQAKHQRLIELIQESRDGWRRTLLEKFTAKLNLINAKKKKRTKGRKSLNKRDKLP